MSSFNVKKLDNQILIIIYYITKQLLQEITNKFSGFQFYLFTKICLGQVFSTTIFQTATFQDEGTFIGFVDQVFKDDLSYDNTAASNNATTTGGQEAGSGTRLFQKFGEQIKKSDVYVRNTAFNNTAISLGEVSTDAGPATAGDKNVFYYLKNSDVELNNNATYNYAVVDPDQLSTGSNEPTALAGVENQVNYVKKTDFTLTNYAANNDAVNNFTGKAISGIVNSADRLKIGTSLFDNTAINNTALANEGIAVSGVQNNVRDSKNNGNEWTNFAEGNNATSLDGLAVSGVQNNIGYIKNDGKGNNIALDTTDKAYNNNATSFANKAISGVQTSIVDVKNADIEMDITADGNTAQNYDIEGETPDGPYDAVAGVDINIGKIKNSDTDIQATSTNNVAKNFQSTPGDAVAGVDITVGSLINTNKDFEFDVTSEDNYAYSKNGDAVGDSRVTIGVAKNADIKDKFSSNNNAATAPAPTGVAVDTPVLNVVNESP